MRRDLKKYIETEIRYYPETVKEYEMLKDDIIGSTGSRSGGRNQGVSKVVENKVVRLLTNKRLKRMEDTIKAVDYMLSKLDGTQKDFVRMYYWEKRYTLIGVALELNCSERTLYRWVDKVCSLVAYDLGLID